MKVATCYSYSLHGEYFVGFSEQMMKTKAIILFSIYKKGVPVCKTFKSCYGQQEIIVHANFSSPEPNACRETSVT